MRNVKKNLHIKSSNMTNDTQAIRKKLTAIQAKLQLQIAKTRKEDQKVYEYANEYNRLLALLERGFA